MPNIVDIDCRLEGFYIVNVYGPEDAQILRSWRILYFQFPAFYFFYKSRRDKLMLKFSWTHRRAVNVRRSRQVGGGKDILSAAVVFTTRPKSKTCRRLSLKTLWVISLSPVQFHIFSFFSYLCPENQHSVIQQSPSMLSTGSASLLLMRLHSAPPTSTYLCVFVTVWYNGDLITPINF